MKTYQENQYGSYSIGNMYFDKGNKHYGKMIKEVAKGKAQILTYVKPKPSAKQIHDDALNALVYDFKDGRIIQTRPQDERHICNAIEYMDRNNIASTHWLMADNKKHPITLDELITVKFEYQSSGMKIREEYVNRF